MLKFLLYLLLFIVLFRIIGAVIRMMVSQSSQKREKKPRNSNVHVNPDSKKGSKGYKGGEYIDYEEVD